MWGKQADPNKSMPDCCALYVCQTCCLQQRHSRLKLLLGKRKCTNFTDYILCFSVLNHEERCCLTKDWEILKNPARIGHVCLIWNSLCACLSNRKWLSISHRCHRFIAGPCARSLHIHQGAGRRAQPNAVLEKVFTSITKVCMTYFTLLNILVHKHQCSLILCLSSFMLSVKSRRTRHLC